MQQRQLRLGDILDDYCPRERRLTNHVIVAMVGDDVKQTRCTTCDADHEYKHAKVPRPAAEVRAGGAGAAGAVPVAPKKVVHEARPDERRRTCSSARGSVCRAHCGRGCCSCAGARRRQPAPTKIGYSRTGKPKRRDEHEEGPVHRPLIRAQLPRTEGQPPAPRQAPDFTIRQPAGRHESLPSASSACRWRQRRRAGLPGESLGRQHERQHPGRSAASARWAAAGRAAAFREAPRSPGSRRAKAFEIAGSRRALSSQPMSDLSGKHGLIVGVANKRSISWAIAQAAARGGRAPRADVSEPSGSRTTSASSPTKLDNPLVLPCDVSSDEQIAELVASIDREFGGLDFLVHGASFAPAHELSNSVRPDLARGFPDCARRQRLFAHRR